MKIFIDTANLDEIRKASNWGIIDGVTTNPSLVSKEGKEFKSVISDIAAIIDGPISAEAISTKTEEIIKEAVELASWHKNIVVKIPMTENGISAVSKLSQMGIKTNVTLIFSVNQGLLAAKAGATFVSPFVGRIDDIGWDGISFIRELVDIYDLYGFSTEIIAASIRHPLHVIDAAKAGSHIATVPFKIIELMFKHPLTDIGIEKFLKDWEKVEKFVPSRA